MQGERERRECFGVFVDSVQGSDLKLLNEKCPLDTFRLIQVLSNDFLLLYSVCRREQQCLRPLVDAIVLL